MSTPPGQPGAPDPHSEQSDPNGTPADEIVQPKPDSYADSADDGPHTLPQPVVPGEYPPSEESPSPVPNSRWRVVTIPYWALAGGGVLVIAVVYALLFAFGAFDTGPDKDSPDGVAQAAAAALQNQDGKTLNSLGCTQDQSTNPDQSMGLQGSNSKWAEQGKAVVTGATAVAVLHLSASYQGHAVGVDFNLVMNDTQGSWCVPANGLQAVSSTETIDGKKVNG